MHALLPSRKRRFILALLDKIPIKFLNFIKIFDIGEFATYTILIYFTCKIYPSFSIVFLFFKAVNNYSTPSALYTASSGEE